MEYKGYHGVVEFDDSAGVFFGRVIGLRDVITFQGESVGEVRQAFRDSVDDYLDFCAERGEPPEKPYSGKFVVRLKPELHRALAVLSEKQNKSLNAMVEELVTARIGASPSKEVAKKAPTAGSVDTRRGPRFGAAVSKKSAAKKRLAKGKKSVEKGKRTLPTAKKANRPTGKR